MPCGSSSTRRRLSRSVLAVTAALVLGACGGAPAAPDSTAPSPGSDTVGRDTVGRDTAAFPVTIRHAFGEVTIPEAPQRVVTLGISDLALATALGAPVVGSIPNFVPGEPVPPYLEGRVDPEILGLDLPAPGASINIEQVAAYDPDLVLAVSSSLLTPDAYSSLSGIAPVVAYEESLYGSTMQEDALLIGRALGDEAGAAELVEQADAAVARFATERPGLAGRTYLYGQARGDVLPMVVGADNNSTIFMRGLGLSVPESFANAPATGQLAPGTIGLSYEEAGRLDEADVLFMTFATPGDRSTFESNPLVSGLPIVTDGRYEAITLDTAVALQGPNVVAVPWLLEQLTPALDRIAAPAAG